MNPETLVEKCFRLNEFQNKALKKLGIKMILDLFYHFPVRYGDTSEIRSISSLVGGDKAVVFGKISGLKMSKGFRTKIAMAEGWIEYNTGKIKTGALDAMEDSIPPEIIAKYHLPSFKTAIVWIHAPQKRTDALAARKRFAFEEVFLIQLEKQKEKRIWQKEQSFVI